MTDDEKTPEEHPTEEAPTREAPPPPPPPPHPASRVKRLLRSRDDRVIAGVAGGLGRYFDVDPVIFRIGLAVSILFGGVGIVAYLAAAIFVPADDGAGAPAPGSRSSTVVRGLGVAVLALIAFGLFGAAVAGAAFATGLGYGLAVVGAILLIGVALIATAFRGGARWLIVPALALTIGVGAAEAADLDLEGGIGNRTIHPMSAAEIPGDGYELGVGRLAVDLRDIDWSPGRVLKLNTRMGVGETVIAVPRAVCVVADAHAGVGELQIAGESTDGPGSDLNVGEGSATPRLVLDADTDVGMIRVVNADDADISAEADRGGPFQRDGGSDAVLRDANARACAG